MDLSAILIALFTAFGIPIVLYLGKWNWDRHRWKLFTAFVIRYIEEDIAIEQMSADDVQVLVAVLLTDAGFEPNRALDLMPLAVPYTRGIISRQLREGRIRADIREEYDVDGPREK